MPPHPAHSHGPVRYHAADEWHARTGVHEQQSSAYHAMHRAWTDDCHLVVERDLRRLVETERYARAALWEATQHGWVAIMHASVAPYVRASFYELVAQEARHRHGCAQEATAALGVLWDEHVKTRYVKCFTLQQCVDVEAEKRARLAADLQRAHCGVAAAATAAMIAAKVDAEAPYEERARRGVVLDEEEERVALWNKVAAEHPQGLLQVAMRDQRRPRAAVAEEEDATRARLAGYYEAWEHSIVNEKLFEFECEVRARIGVDEASGRRALHDESARLLRRVLGDVEAHWREYVRRQRAAGLRGLEHVFEYGFVGLLSGTRLINLEHAAAADKQSLYDVYIHGLGTLAAREQQARRDVVVLERQLEDERGLREQLDAMRSLSRSALSRRGSVASPSARGESMRSVRFHPAHLTVEHLLEELQNGERVMRGRCIRAQALEFDALASACAFQAMAFADLADRRAYIAQQLSEQRQREMVHRPAPSPPFHLREAPFYGSRNRETLVHADHARFLAHQLPVNATYTAPPRFVPARTYGPQENSPVWV